MSTERTEFLHTAQAQPTAHPSLEVVDSLLRDSPGTFARIAEERALVPLMRSLVLTIVFGSALFGAAMGSFRGGAQIAYAALKLPLVLLLTTALCAPALSALGGALQRRMGLQRDLALVVSALARISLALAALSPLVLLGVRFECGYHTMVLLVVGCCTLAGSVGIAHFWRGLRVLDERAVFSTSAALLCLFAVVGSQLAWTLRPFLVRPRAPEVTLVRSVEGSFFDAVRRSTQSAAGLYTRPSAPLESEADR
jgi:hypothetical protein